MCLRNEVTDKTEQPVVGRIVQLTDCERRAEIDYRVMVRLGEQEYLKRQYTRGIYDALYVVFIIGMVAYIAYTYWNLEE